MRRRRGISPLGPPRRRDLRWFELSRGARTSVRALRRHLGTRAMLRVVAAVLRRARLDPLRGIAVAGWDPGNVALARHQLRPVLLLDDALRDVLALSDDRRLAILRDVVADTGAEFVRTSMPVPERASWRAADADRRRAFARSLTARMFNTRVEQLEVAEDRLEFDVTACLFVELCRAARRPEVAPLFCEADARRFDCRDSLVSLRRTRTIAGGDERCDFRFRYRD